MSLVCRRHGAGVAVGLAGGRKSLRKGIPIRKSGRDAARMSRNRKGLRAVLREITQSADRSSLFWWMVEHHDKLKTTAAGRRLQWAALCTRFAELSLTDINGKPASPRTARETWLHARRAVEDANRRLAVKPPARVGAVYPSRIPKEWRPTVVPPIAPSPAGAGIPAPVAKPGVPARAPALDPPLTEEEEARVEAALDQAREQFREKDWYLNPFHPQRGEQTNA